MKRKLTRWTILWVAGILAALVGCIVITGIVEEQIAAHNDQQLFERAAHDIHLPARYQLVESTFHESHSIDTSSYTLIRYKTADGREANLQEVIDALNQSTYTHIESFWKKRYGNTDVYITSEIVDASNANEILVRISLGN